MNKQKAVKAVGAFLLLKVLFSAPAKPRKFSKGHKGIKERVLTWLPLFKKYGGKKGIYKNPPLDLLLALAHAEGQGKIDALSKAGALGIMQLMPKTARGLKLRVDSEVDERLDPEKNIEAGIRLLVMELYKKYRNWDKVLAAYNSGNPDPDKRREYINLVRGFLPLYKEFEGQ